MKIKDWVALVTGSIRGLGLAFCEALLRSGAAKMKAPGQFSRVRANRLI